MTVRAETGNLEKMRKQTILLTGATGFIGSAVLKQIIKDGNTPIVLKRPTSDLNSIKDIKGYKCFTYETLQEQQLIDDVKACRPDVFIHLAWHGTSGKERNEPFQVTDNIPLTLNAVEFAQKTGCRQWIGIGSQAEYGTPNRKVDESFPTNPTTAYGKAKLTCCQEAINLCRSYRMIGSWIRVFYIYGPEQGSDWLIPYLAREMSQGRSPKLTKCEQVLEYLYIDDAAEGILSIAYNQATGIFNLGSGVAVPLKQIVETIREMVNPQIEVHYGAIEYRPNEVMLLQADISKIKEATGWAPKTDLQQGLGKTVRLFTKQYR